MGSNSSSSLNDVKTFSLNEFKEIETPRKMTVHILSDDKSKCATLAEFLTGEKIKKFDNQLLEKNIKKKLKLYSFMNYIFYDSPKNVMKIIKDKSHYIDKYPKSDIIYSEMIIILDNDKIEEQISEIQDEISNDDVLSVQSYFNPFIIILSSRILDLKDFIRSKTFQYKINLKDILNFNKIKEHNDNTYFEIMAFFRRINVVFSYYNELGDIFSFKNSEGNPEFIKIEDDTNISVYINILLLGRSGAGKSTLINILLDEKKSIEGGTGFSTTSKNIIVYKKENIPLRLYDVKGIENEETINNYYNLLKTYNGKNSASKDCINAIFYCMEYKTGTIIEEMENKIFNQLTKFEIPILFIITKCPYDPSKKSRNSKSEKAKETERNKIENAVKDLIKSIFQKNNRKEEADKFIKNYLKFYYVNLVRDLSKELPPFGIDKLLSFFTNSVSSDDWDNLEKSCFKNEEENCQNYCKRNPFLNKYSDFQTLNERNKNEALDYLKGLKAGAFFSGWVPGLDIGMEYFYRKKFKEKLKYLYGFDYEKAEKFVKENLNTKNNKNQINGVDKTNDNKITIFEEELNYTREDLDERSENIKLEESHIDLKIEEEVINVGRNTGAVLRGAGEIGGIVLKALPTAGATAAEVGLEVGAVAGRIAITGGLKIASWVLFPITCIAFGAWSCVNIHKDCHKILDIFEQAFTPLRFETLYAYIKSFRTAIKYLEFIGKKIIQDEDDEE